MLDESMRLFTKSTLCLIMGIAICDGANSIAVTGDFNFGLSAIQNLNGKKSLGGQAGFGLTTYLDSASNLGFKLVDFKIMGFNERDTIGWPTIFMENYCIQYDLKWNKTTVSLIPGGGLYVLLTRGEKYTIQHPPPSPETVDYRTDANLGFDLKTDVSVTRKFNESIFGIRFEYAYLFPSVSDRIPRKKISTGNAIGISFVCAFSSGK